MKKNKLTAMILMVMMISVLSMTFTGCEKEYSYPKLIEAIPLENIEKIEYQQYCHVQTYLETPEYQEFWRANGYICELDSDEEQYFFDMLKNVGYKWKGEDWVYTYNNWSYIIYYTDGSTIEIGDVCIYPRGKETMRGPYFYYGNFRPLVDIRTLYLEKK